MIAHECTILCWQAALDAQLELFRAASDAEQQRIVVNADDGAAAHVLAAAAGVPAMTYGITNASADVRVESLELTLWQTTVRT
jgi:UDP-N-acetylmuramate-alanine ligase